MQLLVSVADPREARAALAGGADVIDAKDPRRGALGAVAPHRLRAICDAVGAHRPVSAALGDATEGAHIGRAAQAAVEAGVTYVKVGFRGIGSPARVRHLAAAAGAAAGVRLILVAYADWEQAHGPPPVVVLEVAAAAGATGVLMDTAFKGAGLFELTSRDTVETWVTAAHGAGLLVALAGGLKGRDLQTVREVGADIVGVRGAACNGGRTGSVSVARVAALSALADRAPLARSGARV
jgi:(5-formylfuran-3-yl)methyl phosphate synthase